MLNYIWGGLIIFSLIFALVNDGNDIIQDNWQNGHEFSIEVSFPVNADISRNQNVFFTISGDTVRHRARWYPVDEEAELIITVSDQLPEHWRNVAVNQESGRKQELRAYVAGFSLHENGGMQRPDQNGNGGINGNGVDSGADPVLDPGSVTDTVPGSVSESIPGSEQGSTPSSAPAGSASGSVQGTTANDIDLETAVTDSITLGAGQFAAMMIVLPEVNFVKLRAITAAAFEMAEFAVTLAIGLIGIMALWLGLMKIAEESGLIHIVVKGVRPFMKWLFPELPKDHPAIGMISLNLAANVLGLGNAATPLGIKAMEELQKLNPEKDTATNSMCMFLALNTSSVQLLPPVTLVAIMGMRVNELMVAITLTTIFSTMAGIAAAKWYARRNPPKAVNPETVEMEANS